MQRGKDNVQYDEESQIGSKRQTSKVLHRQGKKVSILLQVRCIAFNVSVNSDNVCMLLNGSNNCKNAISLFTYRYHHQSLYRRKRYFFGLSKNCFFIMTCFFFLINWL